MNSSTIVWRDGDPVLCAQIDRAFARALEDPRPIHASARRTLFRASLAPIETDVVLKVYHRRRALRRIRETIKGGFGHAAAQREWAALERMAAAGVPVPAPLARGHLAEGGEILVTRYVPGRSLLETLPDVDSVAWNAICVSLATAIRALHDAGLRHGDLHAGNLLLGETGIVLLDLQRSGRFRGERDRLADLARLEFSLRRSGASWTMSRSLRAALGVGTELDAAILRFSRDHQRGRSRRRLRVGADWERLRRSRRSRGLGIPELDLSLFAASTDSAAADGRPETDGVEIRRTERTRIYEMIASDPPIIRKEVLAGSWLRAIADRFRGSAGARAFHRGQADRLISDRAAPALGYLDLRRSGLPVLSGLLMAKVGEVDLDGFEPRDAAEAHRVARALGLWLAEGHAAGLSHRDLKGGNIRIRLAPPRIRFWLVDLQDLTGPAPVPESARIESLCQISASLTNEAFDRASRMAALEAYAERLPFDRPLEAVAAEVAERSLARRHRWRGEDCMAVDRN